MTATAIKESSTSTLFPVKRNSNVVKNATNPKASDGLFIIFNINQQARRSFCLKVSGSEYVLQFVLQNRHSCLQL